MLRALPPGVLLAVLLTGVAACATAGGGSPQPTLAGTWRIVSFEDWDAAGNVTYAFGEHPVGYLVYDGTGRFFFNLMRTPPLPPGGFAEGRPTQEEKLQALDAYASYFGTYSVDWTARTVIHHVEGSLNPALTGTDQPRPFELSGDTLTLGDQKAWKRVFVRVPSGS